MTTFMTEILHSEFIEFKQCSPKQIITIEHRTYELEAQILRTSNQIMSNYNTQRATWLTFINAKCLLLIGLTTEQCQCS